MSSVSRSKLVGMQVYNPDGTFVGTIEDIVLPLGEGEISLQVMTRAQKTETIGWSKVGSVGDIVILKEKVEVPVSAGKTAAPPPTPAVAPAAPPAEEKKGFGGLFRKKEKPLCPTCGKTLTFIDQYQRWYCYNCGRYV